MKITKQLRHLIVLIPLLFFGLSAHAHIYLDPSGGDDTKDGSTYDNRVQSLGRAMELSRAEITANPGVNKWIILCGTTITISSNTEIDGTTSRPDWPIHIKRSQKSDQGPHRGPIFTVSAETVLKLSNIVLDGTGFGSGDPGYIYGNNVAALIYLNYGDSLVINAGTVLQKNRRIPTETTAGSPATDGGAIEGVRAHVTMNGGRITDCRAARWGGGIYLYSTGANSDKATSWFTMNGGEIDNCETFGERSGGGVYINGTYKNGENESEGLYYAQVTLHGGKIHDNLANFDGENSDNGRGGGIVCSHAKVKMDSDEMEIYNNKARKFGGGIQIIYGSEFTFSAGKIYNNTITLGTASTESAAYSGGAGIHVAEGYGSIPTVFTMTGGEIYGNKTIYNNVLMGYGGGIHTSGKAELDIRGGKIYDNEAKYGGAISLQYGRNAISFSNMEIYGNKAHNGGAIAIDGSQLSVTNVSIHDNMADGTGLTETYGKGGAFYLHTDNTNTTKEASVEMYGGSICNNTSTNDGGAIYIKKPKSASGIASTSPVLIQGGRFEGNSAGNRGGGIYANYGAVTLKGADIINNTAVTSGGGILIDGGSTIQVGTGVVNVKGNTAAFMPSNVYLSEGKKIEILADATFTPKYIGIYTEKVSEDAVDVISGNTAEQISAIYSGMTSNPVTMDVVDDRQVYSPQIKSGTTPANTIIEFSKSGSPWSPLQQQTTTSDLHPVGSSPVVYEISNVKELTAFLWHVNGITTHGAFGSGDQAANGKLMADIDMEGHYWVPISTGYTGTFDGNGHTISNLTMTPTNASAASAGRGLFGTNTSGTIKNVVLKDCHFGASTANTRLGGIVSNNGGTVNNCVVDVSFIITDSRTDCVIGGVAGYNNGTIHSCYASSDMKGYQMGGLVGSNYGNLYNSFANTSFDYLGSTKYWGGLAGGNGSGGLVENCYCCVRGTEPSGYYFGWLVGNNANGSTLRYCYIPSGKSPFKRSGVNPSGHGWYGTTALPVLYDHSDNQVSLAGDAGVNNYVPSGSNKQLCETLNNWVTTQNTAPGEHPTYTYWLRPWQKDDDSKFINDDLPLLKQPYANAVASSKNDACLDYHPVNDLLTAYNTANDAVLFYGAESSMESNSTSAAALYIDQEATLKQSGSKGAINARTSQMLQTYTAERWHHFSSPLQSSGIGFNYGITTEVGFSWDSNPCNVTFSSNDDDALFPSNTPSITDVDLYCFYEPEYHWINFKRNSISHWHLNATNVKINYRGNGIEPIAPSDPNDPSNGNETYLVPGKGYLVSVDVDQLVQNYGTLNDGNVTLYSVTKSDYNAWAERLGFNLLGNPYQSYLDFEAFKTQNGTSLWASDEDIYEYTYAVFDPQLNAYRQYKDGSSVFSNAASQYIHPHQGFFIRKTANNSEGTTVTYTDDMRVVTLPGDATSPFRGEAQPAFPLINLVVSDSEGNADLAVLELDRANDEGAEKIRLSEGKGLLSLGYEGRDYGILFRTEIEDYQPLRFEALEEGTFTLEWNTANGQFSELTLIDNIAGTTTDMLSRDSYSFEGNPDQYASRFKIVIGDYKDIDEFEEDGPSTGSGTFAFVMGDELVVNGEGTLSLYDVTGRLLMQTSLHGSQTNIALPEVSAGVYVLRLASDRNGMKTQKIILE